MKAFYIFACTFIIGSQTLIGGLSHAQSGCGFGPRFSEEQRPASCPRGQAVKGIECSGRYCDNKRLYCCDYTNGGRVDKYARFKLSDWFSEEKNGRAINRDGFVSGLACKGRYCDNLRITFVESRSLTNRGQCERTDWFSEEEGFRECPRGKFAAGIYCAGRYCDDIKLYCCDYSSR